jgi:hypothetical protein
MYFINSVGRARINLDNIVAYETETVIDKLGNTAYTINFHGSGAVITWAYASELERDQVVATVDQILKLNA